MAFCHPDLGLGGEVVSVIWATHCGLFGVWLNLLFAGAERLVVDAAHELSLRGHKVRLA